MFDRPRHFFIVGCQRSGTTSLAKRLDQMPGVRMAKPIRPEPKYFLRPDADRQSPNGYREAVFGGAVSEELLGEKSTSYVERPDALRRISETFPEARILCLVRDPIARALSNVNFSIINGFEDEAPEVALLRELSGDSSPPVPEGLSVSPFNYLARSRYDEHLRVVRALFGTRLLVIQSEQLFRPSSFARVLEHLEISIQGKHAIDPGTASQTRLSVLPVHIRRELQRYFRPTIEALLEMDGIEIDLHLWPSWYQNET
jgi:hypothetical protein